MDYVGHIRRLGPTAFWRRRGGPVRMELLRLLAGASRRLAVLAAVLVAISAVLPVLAVVASGHFIGTVPAAVRSGFGSEAGSDMIRSLVAVAVIFILQSSIGSFRGTVFGTLSRKVDGQLRKRVMGATLGGAGVAHLEEPELLDKVALARGVGPNEITPGAAGGALLELAAQRLSAVGYIALLASYRWWLPVVLAAPNLMLRRIYRTHLLKVVALAAGVSGALRRANYFRDLALRPVAAKETRIFGLGDWISERFRTHWLSAMVGVWKERDAGRWRIAPGIVAVAVADLAAFVVVGHAAASRAISLADLVRFTGAIGALGGVVLSMSNEDLAVEYGSASLPAVRQLEEALASPRLRLDGDGPSAGMPTKVIRFEGVRFRYPGSERPVYDGLDLEIHAGQSLAVVGSNGAGKTTLIKLLARLYDPSDGRITVDGIDLRELDPAGWQRRVAAIFQDFTRYEFSARDNVGFGALGLLHDQASLERAARRAGALHVIEALPAGWDTVLSRQFTDGTDLSGGQWQRVALARALLAVDAGAGVLVLDEPTANLDARAEAEVYERFLELTRGITTIVISHRFSTVRRADRIVVLEHGRVIEDGDHDSLLAEGGRYAHMFLLQAARFTLDRDSGVSDASGTTTDA